VQWGRGGVVREGWKVVQLYTHGNLWKEQEEHLPALCCVGICLLCLLVWVASECLFACLYGFLPIEGISLHFVAKGVCVTQSETLPKNRYFTSLLEEERREKTERGRKTPFCTDLIRDSYDVMYTHKQTPSQSLAVDRTDNHYTSPFHCLDSPFLRVNIIRQPSCLPVCKAPLHDMNPPPSFCFPVFRG